jgi:hypothetical protein
VSTLEAVFGALDAPPTLLWEARNLNHQLDLDFIKTIVIDSTTSFAYFDEAVVAMSTLLEFGSPRLQQHGDAAHSTQLLYIP